jgi:D-arabinose 1-dehydrogenase-like Zn-dependent alcohol dehydrogenase
MRAAVMEDFGKPLVVRDVPDPVCPPDGVVVRVGANGICRTDWALWAGNFWSGGPDLVTPFVLGHEFSGTIAETGRDVRSWRVGDRVVFPMNPGEGTCEMCRSGNQQVCEGIDGLVPGVSYWGAFAEFVVARHADVNLVALPESVGFTESASLACRYMTAFHGIVDQAQVRGGEWVAVYGAGGGIGLSTVQVAAAVGAKVIAVDIFDEKLALARELGAVHTINASRDEPTEAIMELTGGGAHVSIDTLGIAESCQNSVLSLRRRGRHVQMGHTTKAEAGVVSLPIDVMMVKEQQFLSAFGMQGQRFGPMLAMIEAGTLEPGKVVSRTVGLAGASDILEAMGAYETTGVVVIDDFL